MTEYLISIVGDADRWWTSMTSEEIKAGCAEYYRKHLKPGGVVTDQERDR